MDNLALCPDSKPLPISRLVLSVLKMEVIILVDSLPDFCNIHLVI